MKPKSVLHLLDDTREWCRYLHSEDSFDFFGFARFPVVACQLPKACAPGFVAFANLLPTSQDFPSPAAKSLFS